MNTPAPTTAEEATDMAWTLANAMTNVVKPALRSRDQLIKDLIRDAERSGDDLGGMLLLHRESAERLGVYDAQ